jgi:NAD-dependent dihydropyrimidine dehydrogenase PreA subunit
MTLTYPKNGDTLALSRETCIGCGACVDVCPHAVFRVAGGKAEIARRETCMECGACAMNCPVKALSVKKGVGCAGAIIMGKLRGLDPSCGDVSCGPGSCCGSSKDKTCC